MTLKEGLPLIDPSPYGETDDRMLGRFESVRRTGDSIEAVFRLVFYTDTGKIYNDSVCIGEKASFSNLEGWYKSRKRRTLEDHIRTDELNQDGYELYDVHKLYQRFQHEINQVKGPEA